MSDLLRGEGLSRSFDGVHALADVGITVAAGEIVAVAGPSGSGKSTLLAILGGLDEPTSGRVLMQGRDFYRLPRRERAALRAAHVGFVFQTHNLLATLTAEENVALAASLSGGSRREPLDRARRALSALGLEHVRDRLPRAISLGEQQRVAIARALAATPRILIADEPTASLDGASGKLVLAALATVARSGCAVLLASHDERCLTSADRVLQLCDGRLRGGSERMAVPGGLPC